MYRTTFQNFVIFSHSNNRQLSSHFLKIPAIGIRMNVLGCDVFRILNNWNMDTNRWSMLWFVLFSESCGAEGRGIRNRKRGSEHDNWDPQTRSCSQYVGCLVNLETLKQRIAFFSHYNYASLFS